MMMKTKYENSLEENVIDKVAQHYVAAAESMDWRQVRVDENELMHDDDRRWSSEQKMELTKM